MHADRRQNVSANVALGYSGLPLAQSVKRELMPGLSDSEYAATQGSDAAAAIAVNGAIVSAAAQERYDGIKHSASFPTEATNFCLESIGAKMESVDVVAHAFSYAEYADLFALDEFSGEFYTRALSPSVNQEHAERMLGVSLTNRYESVEHHFAHAASAYYPSGYRDSLVLVSDGLGERSSTTVWHGSTDGIERLRDVGAINSLGLLYGIFTMYLGFRFADGEYKVMGLAPLGNSAKTATEILKHFVELLPDGKYRVPLLLHDITAVEKETHRGAIAAIEEVFGPRRAPGEVINARHKDIAAGVQAVLEMVQFHVLRHFRRESGLTSLALAGGVALNCAFNGALLRSGLFDRIYVQPASGDDGAAIGAALAVSQRYEGASPLRPSTLLGPSSTDQECRDALVAINDGGSVVTEPAEDEELIGAVIDLVLKGAVVGWFSGRMEFGPRALGNRSIIADPRRPEIRSRINKLVKKREGFRPFAPAVVAEDASRYFLIDPGNELTFREMLFVTRVRDPYIDQLPAVTHVDGSARVQTVFKDDNPRFWQLLKAMDRGSGYPILLNTSFNVAGQPIVRTPEDAVQTYVAAGLDALVLGPFLVTNCKGGLPA